MDWGSFWLGFLQGSIEECTNWGSGRKKLTTEGHEKAQQAGGSGQLAAKNIKPQIHPVEFRYADPPKAGTEARPTGF